MLSFLSLTTSHTPPSYPVTPHLDLYHSHLALRSVMPVATTCELSKSRSIILPPEIWLLVFEHATALHTFFESYYMNDSIWSPFHDSDEGSITFDAYRAYNIHRRAYLKLHILPQNRVLSPGDLDTIRSIQLVCRRWNTLANGIGIGYCPHVVIHSLKQLKFLVALLEDAKFRARKAALSVQLQQHRPSVDIGWHVTHVKIVNMPLVTTRKAEAAFTPVISRGPMTEWEVRCLDGELSGSFISYFRRFLACCPNIQVILDTTSQYDNEQCLPFLGAIQQQPNTRRSAPLCALEYTQGSPSLWDLYSNPQVANTLTRLRGLTLHFPPESFTHNEPLNLPNLTSLDMHLSSYHHIHWLDASKGLLLPSLTHLTVRAPYSAIPFIGVQAMISLRRFFVVYGVGLESLELIIGNAPVGDGGLALPFSAVGPQGVYWNGDDVCDVPALLRLCPMLEELVLDTRLIDLDTMTSTIEQAEALSRRWSHQTLRRIGIRGSQINALLMSIAFARTSLGPRSTGSPNGEVLGPLPYWQAMELSSLRLEDVDMCNFCRRAYGHGSAAAAAAEDVITRTLAILLGSAITTSSASSNSFTSDEDLPTLTKAMNMRKHRSKHSSSLTEIHLLPPPPNASRGTQGKMEMRPCCLRSAPSHEAVYAWQEQCRVEGVALRFAL
jgi:hypothetical protein